MTGPTTLSYRIAAPTALVASADYAAQVPIPVLNGVVLDVNVAYASGSSPTLDLYLQTTKDGGSTWLDIAHLTQIAAATTDNLFVAIPTAAGPTICGEVGDKTVSAGQVSGLPLLSSNVRLSAVVGGTGAFFDFTADLLIPEIPTIA